MKKPKAIRGYFGVTCFSGAPRWMGFTRQAFLLCVLLAALIAAPMQPMIHAQTEESWISVSGINVERFPQVSVTVYGEGLGADLADVEIAILEDGEAQSVTSSYDAVGVQVALVLDASNNISGPGQTGTTRLEEVRNAVSQLTQNQLLLEGKDWLAAVAFDRENDAPKPVVLAPWDIDHQAVINAFYTYTPNPANILTPLVEQISFAIAQFNDERLPNNLQRHIVVFSDGADLLSPRQGDDLAREALAAKVRIHTVQVGPPLAEARRNLQRIAAITGGNFYPVDAEDPLLNGLWSDITASQNQRTLTYRSSHASPQEITAQATTGNGALLRANADFPALVIRPPQVQIFSPESGRIVRGGEVFPYDAPLVDLPPTELEVRITTGWDDRYPREIRSIEYTINGSARGNTAGDVDNATLSIADLDSGTHTIRVRAVDELGLVGESAPLSFEVEVLRQPAPDVQATVDAQAAIVGATATAQAQVAAATATAERIAMDERVEATAVEAEVAIRNLSGVTIGAAALAFVALIFAVVAWRNPRVRQRATEIVTGTIQAVTEPFFGGGGKTMAAGAAKARLILVQGEPTLPSTIDLYSGSTRMGRDPALVNAVLDDRRVSRYHCRIGEEASGAFRIWDEGSMSGTFVNQQPVDMSGRILQPGDIIQVGPASYEFQPLSASAMDATIGYGMYNEATEPYVPLKNVQATEAATQWEVDSFADSTKVDLSSYDSGEFDSTRYLIDDDDDSPLDARGKRNR